MEWRIDRHWGALSGPGHDDACPSRYDCKVICVSGIWTESPAFLPTNLADACRFADRDL